MLTIHCKLSLDLLAEESSFLNSFLTDLKATPYSLSWRGTGDLANRSAQLKQSDRGVVRGCSCTRGVGSSFANISCNMANSSAISNGSQHAIEPPGNQYILEKNRIKIYLIAKVVLYMTCTNENSYMNMICVQPKREKARSVMIDKRKAWNISHQWKWE